MNFSCIDIETMLGTVLLDETQIRGNTETVMMIILTDRQDKHNGADLQGSHMGPSSPEAALVDL